MKKQKATSVYTLGYEGLTLDAFLLHLKKAGIKSVLYVRELPLSRKKGFSKRGFAEDLLIVGIEYRHMPLLGCPKSIRNRYKTDSDWKSYCRDFAKYLQGQNDAVAVAVQMAEEKTTCLVCFEADYQLCHRSIVTSAMARISGLAIKHLSAVKGAAPGARLPIAA